MPEYCFYSKGKHIRVLESTDADEASRLSAQGYEKQFEEVCATDKQQALNRLADIRREKQIDQHNFIAGAGSMPLIGILTAFFASLVRKK